MKNAWQRAKIPLAKCCRGYFGNVTNGRGGGGIESFGHDNCDTVRRGGPIAFFQHEPVLEFRSGKHKFP